jgi:hypothetical protein
VPRVPPRGTLASGCRQNGFVADPAPKPRKPKMSFWVHQSVEYVFGILLVSQALQTAEPLAPMLAGIAILLLALTADGPLGAFRWVPRPVHRVLDLVVAAGCVAAAIVFHRQVGSFGWIFLVVAALALALLVVRTNYRAKPQKVRAGERFVEGASEASGRAEDYGRAAGRAVGKGVQSFRRRPPPTE